MASTVVRTEGEHLHAQQPRTESGRRLNEAIVRLRSAERTQAEAARRASGLSAVDLTALRYLVQAHRDGGDLSPKDLIVMLESSSATVTNVIERLVGHDLVTRVQHPSDRRAHYLVPTPDAIARVDRAFSTRNSAIVTVIDELPETNARTAADVITRLAEAIEKLS